MNIDEGHLIRLTRDLAEDSCPRWSRDGRRVIFGSERGGTFAVYEIEL
jgi:Tol biopolymer transport system component